MPLVMLSAMLSESAAAVIAVVIRRIRPSFRLIDRVDRDKFRKREVRAVCVASVSSSSPPVRKSGLTGTHVDPRNDRSGDRTRTGLRTPGCRVKNTVAGWRGGGFVPQTDTWRHETDSAAPLQRRTRSPLCRI